MWLYVLRIGAVSSVWDSISTQLSSKSANCTIAQQVRVAVGAGSDLAPAPAGGGHAHQGGGRHRQHHPPRQPRPAPHQAARRNHDPLTQAGQEADAAAET